MRDRHVYISRTANHWKIIQGNTGAPDRLITIDHMWMWRLLKLSSLIQRRREGKWPLLIVISSNLIICLLMPPSYPVNSQFSTSPSSSLWPQIDPLSFRNGCATFPGAVKYFVLCAQVVCGDDEISDNGQLKNKTS